MDPKSEIKNFIEKQNSLSTLRYITCGSVDDGKSTLLGRMLYEAQLIFDDQVDNLVKDSKKIGTQGQDIDFALLVDGLSAEREQGITIDVAYRFFSTEKRKFIVADSPGHEQYTRNMVTAASNAELAIILIDSRNGIMPQTKRHSFIANLVGIKHLIVAINKMDLVGYDEKIFNSIVEQYNDTVISKMNFEKVSFVPVSALKGDNIVLQSPNMPWYKKKPLMNILENYELDKNKDTPFILPIQYVNRPSLDFRGFSGTVCSGKINIGDSVRVSSSGLVAKVENILIGDKSSSYCEIGDAVTLKLNKEIDISRGDVLSEANETLQSSDAFLSNLIWFNDSKCYTNRSFILKTANSQTNCDIIKIKNRININSFEKIQTDSLEMNDIAECELATSNYSFLQSYQQNRTLGNFILIDKKSNLTVAAGTIKHNLRRSENVKWQKTEVDLDARKKVVGQSPFVLWFTGLSGSGKSTIANLLEKKLISSGSLTYLIDGDNLRHGLNKDLGFKKSDRIENLRRVGEVAKILHDAGVIVLASFISPFTKDRKRIKKLFPKNDFIEIYVKASLDVVQKRDPKGLYKKAKAGEIPNFTGISSPYEEPKKPDILIDTDTTDPEKSVDMIIKYLKEKKCI